MSKDQEGDWEAAIKYFRAKKLITTVKECNCDQSLLLKIDLDRANILVEELTKQIEIYQKDITAAAGELLIEIPEPGSLTSQLMIVNRLMKKERADLISSLADAKEEAHDLRFRVDRLESKLYNSDPDPFR